MALERRSRMRPPAQRRLHGRVAGTQTARDVTFSGSPIEVRL